MTPEERALELRETQTEIFWDLSLEQVGVLTDAITAAIREAVEAERKVCAEVAELYAKEIQSHGHLPLDPFECAAEAGKEIASAIKARSNTRTSDKSSQDPS